tara:strand:- start:446 stop:649 length:204 start_codon:yes stop_codon:yes gene_type:complete
MRLRKILWPFVSRTRYEVLHDRYIGAVKDNNKFATSAHRVKELVQLYEDRKIGVGKLMSEIRDIYFG